MDRKGQTVTRDKWTWYMDGSCNWQALGMAYYTTGGDKKSMLSASVMHFDYQRVSLKIATPRAVC